MTAPVSITTVCDVTVPWVPFRRALCAVLPHASKEAEWPALCRVRIEARPAGGVFVTATDRFTAALAQLEALVPPGEAHHLDLHPDEVRKILAVFREVKDDLDYTLRLVASPEQLEVRDVSGMVDGERLAVNLMPETDDAPNLPALFARWTHVEAAFTSRPALPFEGLSRFKAALKCWDEALVRMSMVGLNAAVVFVGDQFVGYVGGTDTADEIDSRRHQWANALDDDLPPAARRDNPPIDITDWTTDDLDGEDSNA